MRRSGYRRERRPGSRPRGLHTRYGGGLHEQSAAFLPLRPLRRLYDQRDLISILRTSMTTSASRPRVIRSPDLPSSARRRGADGPQARMNTGIAWFVRACAIVPTAASMVARAGSSCCAS
jgi:hypothetical protein